MAPIPSCGGLRSGLCILCRETRSSAYLLQRLARKHARRRPVADISRTQAVPRTKPDQLLNPVRLMKNVIIPCGSQERTILTGPFKGIRMHLDLRTQTQFYLGLFERELYPWVTRFATGVRNVVDIGAAQGEYTLFALLKTNAERVIAFEPSPQAVEHLQRNLDTNGLAHSDKLVL